MKVTLFPAVGGTKGCVCVLWCRITVHESREAGSVPSSASEALPTSVIVCPTVNLAVVVGEEIFGTGGVLPALMWTVARALAPFTSVTVSTASY